MSNSSRDLDPELQRLLDKDAIRDLPARYCDCIWRSDVGGVLSLFADDGRFVIDYAGKTIEVTGKDRLEPFFADSLPDGPRPYIHNHVIDFISADEARGRCYLDLRSAKHDFDWLGAGYYEDSYIKQDGDWRFRERHFHALRIEEWPGGIAE